MIAFPSTLGQLRDVVLRLIEILGEGAPVGRLWSSQPAGESSRKEAVMDGDIQLEYVFVDAGGMIVGDEANGHGFRVGPGERGAVLIS